MIAVDFAYRRPDTLAGAYELFSDLARRGENPFYLGGGTEIVTGTRTGLFTPSSVIDVKAISDLRALAVHDGRLILGAGLSLREILAKDPWPLLSHILSRIADHSVRTQITLGGNLVGSIPYREAVLPFLLTESAVRLYGSGGDRWVPLAHVFTDGSLRLAAGELLVALSVPEAVTRLGGVACKKTRFDWVDYPLVTVAARRQPGRRIPALAVSGLTSGPFRALRVEDALLHAGPAEIPLRELLPEAPLDDRHGSSAYREFVFRNTLEDVLEQLGPNG